MLLLADWYWQESGLLVMGSYGPSFASVLTKEPGEFAVMFFFLRMLMHVHDLPGVGKLRGHHLCSGCLLIQL